MKAWWSARFHLILITLALSIMPQWLFAKQEPLDWKTHGLIALAIATLGAIGLVMRNKKLDTVTAKIMVFGVYFWLLVFAQAILYGIYYGTLR
ncbi:MAG: hypothetical protein HWE13_08450 [Gammaproteobacteria bacterium]|nr:hypothetical protein [Gammaproteobacteria bacterium]NVK88143.1 hypothetical protein [Gammaproteobacteria bacterium]